MAEVGKQLTITDLRIYPIKSCRGISVNSTTLTRQGLKHDRKWMFVDAKDKFLTIRQKSKMTLIKTAIDEETQELKITFPSIEKSGADGDINDNNNNNDNDTSMTTTSTTISVPLEPDETYLAEECEKLDVEIWEYHTDAWTYLSPTITQAVTNFFHGIDPSSESEVKLVMKGPTAREAKGNGSPEYLGRKESVNFPDVLPILVACMPSLHELNSRLEKQGESRITIERFRPNIVLDSNSNQDSTSNSNSNSNSNNSNLEPWEEDEWRTLTINPPRTMTSSLLNKFTPASLSTSIEVDVSARCARCQVPNVNPETGHKNAHQPWDTLVSYRRVDEGVKYKPCFGMLCCPRSVGLVSVGMDVAVSAVMEAAGGHGVHKYVKGF